jgi:TctA family transporter
MDEHGFSGTDEWVANDRKDPGGVQRLRIARKDMAALLVAFNSSVSGWLALSDVPDTCSPPRVLCTLFPALFSIARRSRRLEELFRVTQERAD